MHTFFNYSTAKSRSNPLRKLLLAGTVFSLALSTSPLPLQARSLVAAANNTAASPKSSSQTEVNRFGNEGSGTLTAMVAGTKKSIVCPLKDTKVTADISGYVARVTVKQKFVNPSNSKIEAVYTFPLSENSAVDEMTMKIGDRTISGTIKKREEARAIYEQARNDGYVASLLDQERTNIFTQSVANIEPGKEIEITIKYIETLPYESGKYTFAFPTVVGPRFVPGQAVTGGPQGSGFSNNTNQVPDASLITPMPTLGGSRAGHNISIDVHLNGGMAVSDVKSALHQIDTKTIDANKMDISLTDKETIPNKDFVLTWQVAQDSLKSGYLTYKEAAEKEGFFTLMLMPPKRVTKDNVQPKEMIFVIDCSGSQSGAPLDKAKETMLYILDHMNDNDTFQIITFNNNVQTFADKPEVSSSEMKKKAKAFINSIQAQGGTWMAPAVEKACAMPNDSHRLRIVTFMTDGYVGNDYEILGMVKKYRGASRWFPFGTGNSVNRTLIDGISKEGGGEAEYVLLNSSAEEAGKKFYDRISSPVLTDVKLAFEGVDVKEVYPKEVSDVWAERPLYFKGKYTAPKAGTVTLTGFAQGKPYKQTIKVDFANQNLNNPGIPSLWARAKVDRLMSEDWFGAQQGTVNKEIKDEIVATALKHHIMTQYTSFVAVDNSRKTDGDKATKTDVPIEMPDGVSEQGVFGNKGDAPSITNMRQMRNPSKHGAMMGSTRGRRQYQIAKGGSPMAGGSGGSGAPGYGFASSADSSSFMAAPMASMPYPAPSVSRGSSGGSGAPMASPAPMPRPKIAEGKKQSLQNQIGGKDLKNSPATKSEVDALVDWKEAVNSQKPGDAEKAKEESGKSARDKIASELKAYIGNNGTAKVSKRGNKILVTIKLNNETLTKAQLAKLKALGAEFKDKNQSGKSRQIFIAPDKIESLSLLDFILSILLAPDLK
ncbi:MAG: VWA domain-containing protein [Candidatus Obscuribacter sp.]|jgi:Ca-activated chloride channel family protein|nr:VWA domain-containing protein [Candidatus Obscuribacter sp.]MBP6348088.1 VWA domain-containing protein [Candidatus Obscuribacter sp.]MBP6591493.1 VWA domain-containing protein [Candidatus Obscuribacter sp.]